jgi:hypothetical protein
MFVRVVGGAAVTSTVPFDHAQGAEKDAFDTSGVLVEAASFAERGGWKLDTQHYLQMGGCYLLAHGMGRPVADARTKVTIPRSGTWHVRVRTRDWCPGDWQAPGRFKVHVNGAPLKPEFGTEGKAWHWQKGGTVDIASQGAVEVELKDLTGFDGRCDAIYFNREASPNLPNGDLVKLAAWKDRLSGRAGKEIKEQPFDVVIVGGGIAGCAAGIAAGSKGLKVALIQDRPLFGGNASEEVRVHTLGLYGKCDELLKTIDTLDYPNGHADAKKDQEKREATMAASGVDLFAGHIAIGLEKEGDRIAGVEAREVATGIIRRFRAPVFIDATGDGWLGYCAGADHRYGREAHTEFGEAWEEHGDLWSPDKPDDRVLGTSVLWNSEDTGERSDFPDVPWAMDVAKEHSATAGEWYWEYSSQDAHQIEDAEQIRDHMLRAIYGSFANAKKDRKNATVALKWVAYVAGKRESRRLMGDYVYTQDDMLERRRFLDTVVTERRFIDLHYQVARAGSKLDFLSKYIFRHIEDKADYYIPFRCLYSRNIANLMMAGRCFSCSHVGLGGPRNMRTLGQMGVATGYAAWLCRKHGVLPRGVYDGHIDELRALTGYA